MALSRDAKEASLPAVCCSSPFPGGFPSPLCSPLHSKLAPNSKGSWLETPGMSPLVMRGMCFLFFKWIYQNSSLSHHPLAVPNEHTVTPKDVSELWSHPRHFHPLSLLWRNIPNTELADSCLSLNTCVLLPLWNVFVYSAVIAVLHFVLLTDSPSQKSYYKITYKIYLVFMLLLYIPFGDK